MAYDESKGNYTLISRTLSFVFLFCNEIHLIQYIVVTFIPQKILA